MVGGSDHLLRAGRAEHPHGNGVVRHHPLRRHHVVEVGDVVAMRWVRRTADSPTRQYATVAMRRITTPRPQSTSSVASPADER